MDGFGTNFNYDVGDDGSSNGARFKRGLFTFLKYAVLVIACLIVFVPLIVVFLGSLKNNTEFLSSNVFALPTSFEWSNYKTAFIDGKVLLGLKNTAIIILISCTGTIITGTMTAYVLQRFKTLFGKEPRVEALHAGLECGIFLDKMPGMDMISFGPTLKDIHSPGERANIPSVQQFWDFLTDMLRRLA